jgi:hypothetical protein
VVCRVRSARSVHELPRGGSGSPRARPGTAYARQSRECVTGRERRYLG